MKLMYLAVKHKTTVWLVACVKVCCDEWLFSTNWESRIENEILLTQKIINIRVRDEYDLSGSQHVLSTKDKVIQNDFNAIEATFRCRNSFSSNLNASITFHYIPMKPWCTKDAALAKPSKQVEVEESKDYRQRENRAVEVDHNGLERTAKTERGS